MTTEQVYVAIDLETTGLNAQQDAVIEIGAVKFTSVSTGASFIHILDRYVTFVNPGRPIPLRVQQLTGICDADISGAPSLGQLVPELLAFVGADTRYVVAHNAGFDSAFLLAGGVDFHRPMQDTFELATILLPGAASYSLVELARAFHIPLPDAHRALDDAEATAHLFGFLLYRASVLPGAISRILLDCGRDTRWEPLHLLADIDGSTPPPRSHAFDSTVLLRGNPDEPATISEEIREGWTGIGGCSQPEMDKLAAFFEPGGCLEAVIGSAYEYRASQAEMSQRVMNALRSGDHLLIEAGTGTGKTLAYLLPSVLWAMHSGERTVVATNTITLQDQILDKDMPLVRSLLQRSELGSPSAALLKGRPNYLCTRRLHLWYRDRALKPSELRLLAKILVWLQETRSGDVGELFMPTAAERAIWQHVNSDGASCSAQRCTAECAADQDVLGSHYRDFYYLAHYEAEKAPVLVVNHALLLTDIETGGRVLPPFDNLVIDEAHRFEEAATDQLTLRTDWHAIIRWLRDLQSQGELCQQMLAACARSQDLDCQSSMHHNSALAQMAESDIAAFADTFLAFFLNHEEVRADTGYAQRIAIDQAFRSQPAWSQLEIEWDRVGASLSELVEELQRTSADLATKRWWQSEPNSSYLAEMLSVADSLHRLTEAINDIVYGTGDVHSGKLVSWAEIDEKNRDAVLVSAPMFVSDRVERELIHGKRSVILTGATLRTGSGYGFIRDRLGLWDVDASSVDSPFDYKTSTLLFMPSDMPDPRSNHYQQAVERAITLATLAAEGSTVALFTSYAQLRATADAIRGPLDKCGITVLEHGAVSRRRLLREYRQIEKAVLLGTRSFWEGVDMPGDELKCLLIVRLPFAVPSDPLVAARTADLENSFRDYTLPDAILRFRQGFGRLIRRSTDRGAVIILDSRVWRKAYGRAFYESLPACTEKHAPLDTLQEEVRAWLAAGSGAL